MILGAVRSVLARARGTRERPIGGARRVWLLTAVIAIAAGALILVFDYRSMSALRHQLGFPELGMAAWVAVAVGFFLAESVVIHLHVGRSAHSFSMSEIPLIAGLFYVAPLELIAARLVGAGLALVIVRRQRSVKLAFNLAQFVLSSVVAIGVLRLVPGVVPTTDLFLRPEDWIGGITATLGENLVGVIAVVGAIVLTDGRAQMRRAPEMLKTGTIVASTNAVLALLALTVVAYQPTAAVLLVVPTVLSFFAYRAYIRQRQQHDGLEMLYEGTRILQRSAQVDSALVSLLQHARRMFRAEVAEITLLPGGPSDEVLRTTVGPGTHVDRMAPIGGKLDDPALDRAIDERRGHLIAPSSADGAPSRFRNAMVAPLVGESRVVGTILVANRLSEISTFDASELTLFETLASHTAIALENGQLEQSLAQLSELKEELRHQAYHDQLTGLANRTLFSERVAARLAHPDAAGTVPVVLFLDLDDFKLVNDTLGHASGDALLTAVGERIRLSLRSGDVAARLGGDEFAILVSDHESLGVAIGIANRLIASFEAPYVLDAHQVDVRASIGVAAPSPDAVTTADELMRNADVAMYQAKAQGKGRIAVFEPRMAVEVATRHQMTASLQRALAGGEFLLNFQPIVEIASGTVVAVESLVRWDDPVRGMVWPFEFIPLAEQSDSILRIGRWVLQESCRQAKAWEGRFDASRPWMSVNISARQLKQPQFVDEVMDIVTTSGVAPGALTLEMTETAMLQDIPDTLAKLRRLRDFGISISVDDFGTGYSSLSYLQRFPVTSLKIARDFVHVDEGEPDSWELASAIVSMGRALHVSVIAEGVEHLYQLNKLRDLGCEYAQGYYLARPMRAERMEQLFAMSGSGPARLWTSARPGIALATEDRSPVEPAALG